MKMYSYLVEREQEELIRTSVRTLTLPDGSVETVEAYRLVWRWFDRSSDYAFGFSEAELMQLALNCAGEEHITLGDALGRVLNHVIQGSEAQGLDYTDDHLPLLLAKRRASRR